MKSLKPKIKSSKINIERFSQTAKQLRREQEERDAKGMQDERAEKGCEWYVVDLRSCVPTNRSREPLTS